MYKVGYYLSGIGRLVKMAERKAGVYVLVWVMVGEVYKTRADFTYRALAISLATWPKSFCVAKIRSVANDVEQTV